MDEASQSAPRIESIEARGSGFIYYVSREGVTGMQQTLSESIAERMGLIRKHTSLPVAVGFGISNGDQARQVAASSDAIVVGSAIVNQIAEMGPGPDLAPRIGKFVAKLVNAIRE